MPRNSKSNLTVVEEYDENEGDFDADDGSDDWQPEPEVSFCFIQRIHAYHGVQVYSEWQVFCPSIVLGGRQERQARSET